jgi:hypothetical protein
MNQEVFLAQLDQCQRRCEVKPGQVAALLKLILDQDGTLTPQVLGRALALPKKNLGRILTFWRDFFHPQSRVIRLTDSGRNFLQAFFSAHSPLLAPDPEVFAQKLVLIYRQLGRDRYRTKRKYDQFLATPATMVKRALWLNAHDDLWRRKLVFLGDDDLTSVAVASLGLAKSLTVIDIDPDILTLINSAAHKLKLPIKTISADLRQDRLSALSRQFEVVFTDPPYTLAGVSLFIDHGLRLLQNNPSSSLYFCYGNSERARTKTLAVQRLLLQKKMVIANLAAHFNQYQGAASIGGNSDLYLTYPTSFAAPGSIKSKSTPIYTHQQR